MNINQLNGKRIAVFDCEIKKRIEDCSRGWDSHDEMGISVLALFDYVTMRYRVFDDRNARTSSTERKSRHIRVRIEV